MGLPASFRSTYRLFWRLSSSAVLHQKQPRRYLRKIYRPFFDAGARVTRDLQSLTENTALVKEKEHWLKTWNKRADGVLSMLFVASKSRGLSHRLFYNLQYLTYSARFRLRHAEHLNPRWSQDNFKSLTTRKPSKSKQAQLEDNAWNALSEVIGMAEGRDNLSLGRIILRRPARLIGKRQ